MLDLQSKLKDWGVRPDDMHHALVEAAPPLPSLRVAATRGGASLYLSRLFSPAGLRNEGMVVAALFSKRVFDTPPVSEPRMVTYNS
eukprot:3563108-Pyramimonas_sp.AAC.1